jgi:hypothetical protein
MKRREFMGLIGSAATVIPTAARAQQSAIPVVGVLSPEGPKTNSVRGLIEGLRIGRDIVARNRSFQRTLRGVA